MKSYGVSVKACNSSISQGAVVVIVCAPTLNVMVRPGAPQPVAPPGPSGRTLIVYITCPLTSSVLPWPQALPLTSAVTTCPAAGVNPGPDWTAPYNVAGGLGNA